MQTLYPQTTKWGLWIHLSSKETRNEPSEPTLLFTEVAVKAQYFQALLVHPGRLWAEYQISAWASYCIHFKASKEKN